jgi:hypothetical protein
MNATAVAIESRSVHASRRRFARHFLEMVVAMFAGMGVLGGLSALGFALAGDSLSDQPGAFRIMLMGVNMTLPMVAWMAYRGHGRNRNMEMAASMLIPSALAAALTGAGVIGTDAGLGIQHAVMVPAMLGVMLWRYDHYARR